MVGAVTLKHFFLINAALLTAVTAAPNIIFIVVDDLGMYATVDCFNKCRLDYVTYIS